MAVFWVDSYYWGTDTDGLADMLATEQLKSGIKSPATTQEIYSAIRNRIERMRELIGIVDQSDEICGKIITVRYN